MIKREIKTFSVNLPNGEIYESNVPLGLLDGMIKKGLCSLEDAENGEINLTERCSFSADIELSEVDTRRKYIYFEVSGALVKGELLFNGKSCGVINGPYRTYLFDVKDKIVVGKNTVEIRCGEMLEPKLYLTRYGERSREYDTAIHISNTALLKAPALCISDTAFIKNINVRQEHKDGKVTLFVNADTVGDINDARVVASLSAPSGKIYFGGMSNSGIKISVSDPELWWPRGYGAQPIYKLTVTLYQGAEFAHVYEKQIGLRTSEALLHDGTAPTFLINGVKVFPRGAAYVKQNAIVTGISDRDIERTVKAAVAANMNTLTVFDENIPLPDVFYELCDKYGLMVWHSVTLPYIAPPAASVFAAGITQSVEDGIKRLALHPSVVLMFLEFAESNKQMMRLFADAIEEFRGVSMKILAPVLNEYIPDIPFIEKSFDIFKYDERYLFEGDASFAGGMIYALPSEYTLKSYIPEDEYNLFSCAAEKRSNVQECVRLLENTVKYMKMPHGMPELVYASEISAGYCISKSIKRARGYDGCASAVLRQLNDGKKTVSSSFIDYFGKEKASMKYIKDAYLPISLDVLTCDGEVSFVLSNFTKKEYKGRLFYALYDTVGTCYIEKNTELTLDSGVCETLETNDLSRFVSDNPRKFYVVYELYDDTGIILSSSEHFVPIKHVEFADPAITAEISGMKKRFSVKLTAENYAYAVKVDFDGLNVNFSDNFVNLYGKSAVIIDFETEEVVTLGELEKRLRIYSPYSIGR